MQVGVIYGNVSSTRFDIAISDTSLRRLDYVTVDHQGRSVLGQVEQVIRKSDLTYEDALNMDDSTHDHTRDKMSASVHVIGFQDENGRVQTPRTPFRAGLSVERADDKLITGVLGLQSSAADGAYLGHVKGSKVPVSLSMNMLAQKHVSVLAKTGAGKSYTVGVVLEEFLKAQVPLVILDPHGEYGSLRNANVDESEVAGMRRFNIKPKAFQKQIREYALDTRINPQAERLVLEGMNLEGREIVDLLGGKISGGQVGVLYQAVKEVKDHLPAYTLKDVMDAVARNKSSAKWNVLNALEALDSTGVFDIRGTPIADLVSPGQCTIINLKGVAPDIQEIIVTRVTNLLWEARKRGEVLPHILVCEEAHNFCPERGVGNAISGAVLRTVASEGRKFGMGLVIVSQRPAKIDKNVLSQCNTQIVLKVTNPNDLKAIVASVEGITSDTADEVQRLPIGSALIAGGGLTQPVFVDVRPRHTRHGGQSIDVVGDNAPKAEPAPPKQAPRIVPVPTARDVRAAQMERRAPEPADFAPEPEAAPEQVIHAADPVRRVTEPLRKRPDPQVRDNSRQPAIPQTFTRTQKVQDLPKKPVERETRGPTWGPGDHEGIHRVASRLGVVGANHAPQHSVDTLHRLALRNGRDPDQRLGLYAEISRKVCHEELPRCIQCPLADACEYKVNLQTERHKSRASIRRLWRR